MAVKDGKEYVSFVAQRLVTYIDTPAEERRRRRTEARSRREPWIARWFGWGAYGVIFWWRSRRERAEAQRNGAADLPAGRATTESK